MVVPIIFATNDDYVPCLYVLLKSIKKHISAQNSYEIFVLCKKLSEESKTNLNQLFEEVNGVTISFVNVAKKLQEKTFYTENRENFTQEAYYRLLIPELFEKYDKVLYMDCDMVSLCDPAEIFQIDIGDCLIGACRDVIGIGMHHVNALGRRDYQRNVLGITVAEDYVISGLLIMNLKAMRDCFQPYEMVDKALQRDWMQHDQDVLNVLCHGRIHYLPLCYNVIGDTHFYDYLPDWLQIETRQALENPSILHFAGDTGKPWFKITERAVEYFWKEALDSPYYGRLLDKIDLQYNKQKEEYYRGLEMQQVHPMKRVMKKILPPPIKSFHREMNRITDSLEEERLLKQMLNNQLEKGM